MQDLILHELKVRGAILRLLKTMPPIISEYFRFLDSQGKTNRTMQSYIHTLSHFLKFYNISQYDNYFYDKIQANQIKEYLEALKSKDEQSTNHQAVSWTVLNSFFQFLVPKYLRHNPVDAVKRPRVSSSKELVFLTTDEISELVESVAKNSTRRFRHRDTVLFKMGFLTELRLSTILLINLQDVDLTNRCIRVFSTKKDKFHYIRLDEEIANELEYWLKVRQCYFSHVPSEALFVSQEGNRLSARSVRDLLEKYSDGIIGKNLSPEVMRNSFVMNLYLQTGDLYACSKRLNLKSVASLQRFAELASELYGDDLPLHPQKEENMDDDFQIPERRCSETLYKNIKTKQLLTKNEMETQAKDMYGIGKDDLYIYPGEKHFSNFYDTLIEYNM